MRITLTLAENALVPVVFGPHDANLARLEGTLGVKLASLGNAVTVEGDEHGITAARAVIEDLYEKARQGTDITFAEVDASVRMLPRDPSTAVGMEGIEDLTIRTRKRHIVPRTPTQAAYIRAMHDHELVFGLGPAGTGKTYLAVAMAVSMKIRGLVDRIILSRPAVEAGERLGFLPGDMREKVDPYLRPLYDALNDTLPGDMVLKAMENQEIEVAPLAFMRGRTLSRAFVILDEAQNTTPMQMKMFLTRLGEDSRMVVTGDMSQVDLPGGVKSGLRDARDVLMGTPGLSFITFSKTDVLRHDLVSRIVAAYESKEAQDRKAQTAAPGKPPAERKTSSDDSATAATAADLPPSNKG